MQKSNKSPFFAKFLENQIESDNKIVGGCGGSGNGQTSPKFDMVYTMKYPSDGEDTGTDI